MEDDRPVVSFWAGRYFVNAVSDGEPSGCPGWHLLAGMRLAGARHRQKIRDSGAGGVSFAGERMAILPQLVDIGDRKRGKDPAYEKRLPMKIGSL